MSKKKSTTREMCVLTLVGVGGGVDGGEVGMVMGTALKSGKKGL